MLMAKHGNVRPKGRGHGNSSWRADGTAGGTGHGGAALVELYGVFVRENFVH